MIEILKLDTETDVCVLQWCNCQLFTAGQPDGKGHSQRALSTLLPLWLIVINTLDNDLIPFIIDLRHFAIGQGLVGVDPYLDVFKPFSPHGSDKDLLSLRQGAPPALKLITSQCA